MIKCVIFDFDGTLVDSNNIKHQSFFDVTKSLGGAKDILEVVLAAGDFGDRSDIFKYLITQLKLDKDDCKHSASELIGKYTALCEERIAQASEIEGATQVLTLLSKIGMRLSISSATPETTLKKIISLRGLSSKFDKIYGAPSSKEQHIQKISNEWMYSMSEIVYVGDSEVDRKAALRVDCHFVGVGKDYSRFKIKPNMMIRSLSDLPVLINKMTLF
jgi:phosphoglycolate phosphatase